MYNKRTVRVREREGGSRDGLGLRRRVDAAAAAALLALPVQARLADEVAREDAVDGDEDGRDEEDRRHRRHRRGQLR